MNCFQRIRNNWFPGDRGDGVGQNRLFKLLLDVSAEALGDVPSSAKPWAEAFEYWQSIVGNAYVLTKLKTTYQAEITREAQQ